MTMDERRKTKERKTKDERRKRTRSDKTDKMRIKDAKVGA